MEWLGDWIGWVRDPEAWIALATLTVLEIVLGIDNIIFISILSGDLPPQRRERGRVLGLALAMVTRIALLFCLTWIMRLEKTLFSALGREMSGRDLILIAGGLFLLVKSTLEIHRRIEGLSEEHGRARASSFVSVLAQIALLDVVFSLDSVITAIGMARHVPVMVIAVVVAVVFMMIFVNAVARFVERHPTIKVLALSLLLLIGVALVADGLDLHIPKGYIYFAMAFSAFVEAINLSVRRRSARTA